MSKPRKTTNIEQQPHSLDSDFTKFTTLDLALGELLCERRKSALLTTELERQRTFFQEQLASLQRTFKKDSQYERELHQRVEAQYQRIYDQELQIYKLLDELRDHDILVLPPRRPRTTAAHQDQEKSDL
jgi:hypothetical protein